MIIPAGHKRQMEKQTYLWNEKNDIIERMLRKAAVLDIAEDNAVNELASPPEQKPVMPDQERQNINDAMNGSNGLPRQEHQDKIMVANKDGQPRQDQQGQVTKQILEMLLKARLADPGTYILTDFDLSNGIQLNAVRQTTNVGPAVQKP